MNLLSVHIRYLLFLFSATLFVMPGCQSSNGIEGNKNASTEGTAWKVIGPGGGGGVLKPTISPFDEKFVLTHCDMTAAYVSLDGGENWKMKNLWNVPEDFEFDPVDPKVVYVATRGFRHSEDRGSGLSMLYRSADKGMTWEIVYPDVSKARKVDHLQNKDLLPSEIISGAVDGTIEKVKVDPKDNHHILLGMAPLKFYMSRGNSRENEGQARLVTSFDQGKTWKQLASLPGENVKAIFPGSISGRKGEVLVFTEKGCVWVNETTGKVTQVELPVNRVMTVEGGTGGNETVIYLLSGFSRMPGNAKGGVYVSRDLGMHWTQSNGGILDGTIKSRKPEFRQGLGVCESRPEVAYLSVINHKKNKEGNEVEIYSIFKTVNGGNSWEAVLLSSSPDGYITNNFEGSWMEKSYDPGWGGAPIDLGVAPGNPDICFAGDNGRGYKTTDGGKTWKQTYSHNQPDGSYSSGGLDVTTCYGVHFDPFNKDHFFICYTDMGLFHTFNGGQSWFHALNGVPFRWQNTCYQVAFDPAVKGRIWSAWSGAHDLPRTKMFGGFLGRYTGGVAVSTDEGKTWQKSNEGLPENSICTNILIDPNSPVDSRTLYVSVFDKGVFTSTDGGKSWTKCNGGLGDNLFAWQLRLNKDGRLFVLFPRGQRNGNTVDGAVYYSDDKAASWHPVILPDSVNGPHDLLLDPENTDRMYLSCWPSTASGTDSHGGLLKTEDGGVTWRQVFDDRYRVNSAGLDPANPSGIFINTFQNAAFRSEDFGENWTRIEGYRFKWGQRAVPDINHPGMLFLSSYGGSVFYGPSAGTPDVQKDILNMPEGWW